MSSSAGPIHGMGPADELATADVHGDLDPAHGGGCAANGADSSGLVGVPGQGEYGDGRDADSGDAHGEPPQSTSRALSDL